MLIRLVSHPEGNSDHVDKLIYIEGLPESFFYRVKDGKKFLKSPPWAVDNDENIPADIKSVYFKNPVTVWFDLPREPISQQMGNQETEYSREANCFVVDYQSAQGEQMWDQIEKILDRETPRDQEVPKPAVVGTRRDWTLSAVDVPAIVLKRQEVVEKKVTPEILARPGVELNPNDPTGESVIIGKYKATAYPCKHCTMFFASPQGLRVHITKCHTEKGIAKQKALSELKEIKRLKELERMRKKTMIGAAEEQKVIVEEKKEVVDEKETVTA